MVNYPYMVDDTYRQRRRALTRRRWLVRLVIAAGCGAALFLVALMSGHASAAWNGGEQYRSFFDNLQNAGGTWCCMPSDGKAYYGDYRLLPDGSAIVPPYGVVKKGNVVRANPTGHAIVWLYYDGTVRCFSPGALT